MLIDVRVAGRRAKAAAGVVINGQPNVVRHTDSGIRDYRSVRLRAETNGIQADVEVSDVLALIAELEVAERWRVTGEHPETAA